MSACAMHTGVRGQLEWVTRKYPIMQVLTIELLPTQPSRWSTGFSLENGAWLSKGSPGRLQRHQRSAALYSIGSQFLSSHMWFQNGPNGTCEGPSWLSVNGSSPQEWPVSDCLRRNYSLGQHKSLDIQTSPFWKIKLIHLPLYLPRPQYPCTSNQKEILPRSFSLPQSDIPNVALHQKPIAEECVVQTWGELCKLNLSHREDCFPPIKSVVWMWNVFHWLTLNTCSPVGGAVWGYIGSTSLGPALTVDRLAPHLLVGEDVILRLPTLAACCHSSPTVFGTLSLVLEAK